MPSIPRAISVLGFSPWSPDFRNNGLTDGTRVWWIPVVAPLLGGLAGAAIYDFGIRRFLRPS